MYLRTHLKKKKSTSVESHLICSHVYSQLQMHSSNWKWIWSIGYTNAYLDMHLTLMFTAYALLFIDVKTYDLKLFTYWVQKLSNSVILFSGLNTEPVWGGTRKRISSVVLCLQNCLSGNWCLTVPRSLALICFLATLWTSGFNL